MCQSYSSTSILRTTRCQPTNRNSRGGESDGRLLRRERLLRAGLLLSTPGPVAGRESLWPATMRADWVAAELANVMFDVPTELSTQIGRAGTCGWASSSRPPDWS